MNRTDVNWRGYWPAAPVPFQRDGGFDETDWRKLIQLYLGQGVHGMLVNGTTGEWFSQSVEERKRIAEIAVDEVAQRIPVVIGCSAFTPREAIVLATHAQEIGADGVLATPPPYVVPTSREIVAFYTLLTASTDLPFMVYNWPRGTNVEIDRELALALGELDTVVAIKDSTANREQLAQTLRACVGGLRIFGGFINTNGLRLLRDVGGDGAIDGGGLGAAFAVKFFEQLWVSDFDEAADCMRRYESLSASFIQPDWSGRFGSPQAQLKAAMNLLGQPGGFPRLPLLPVDEPGVLAEIATALRSAGFTVNESELLTPASILPAGSHAGR